MRSQTRGRERFPDRIFRLTDHSATGDGKTLNTEAFQRAVAAIRADRTADVRVR